MCGGNDEAQARRRGSTSEVWRPFGGQQELRGGLQESVLNATNGSGGIDRRTGTRYNPSMIQSFRHRGLRQLYERGDPSRIGADLLDRITLALADLDAAGKPSDIDMPGYRLHPLRGDRRGSWSIAISGNWRVTFRFEDGDAYDVDLVDYH